MRNKWQGNSSKPGANISVANKGAVHFECLADWIVAPVGKSICIYHGKEQDDNIRIQVPVTQIGPNGITFNRSKLQSLAYQMEHVVLADDNRHRTRKGPMIRVRRRDLEYA